MVNNPMSRGYHPLSKVFLLFSLTSRTALLYAGIVIGIDFFRRRHYVPKLVVGFLLAYLVILVAEKLLMRRIMEPLQEFLVTAPKFWTRELVMTTLACLIWVPYFLFSKRVKAMFKIADNA
jgi:uncharacterized protein DUF2569